MINNRISSSLSFGRALTTAELQLLNKSLEDARKKEKANIKTLAIGLPVAAAPPTKDGTDSGIGNLSGVAEFMDKAKGLMGLNTALFLPLGESYSKQHSPFSTGSFGIYHGYFDPNKLTTKEYGNLLEEKDIPEFKIDNKEKTQYKNIEHVETVLNKAYDSFENGNNALKDEFEQFKQKPEINYWLDTYAGNKEKENPERYKFKQFLLHKFYKDTKKELNDKGFDIIVDIPVGADREIDAKIETEKGNNNPFISRELGSYDDAQGKWVGWGLYPLDPSQMSAQELQYWKARYHGFLGNGARLDCFQGNMLAADGNGVLPEYQQNPEVLAKQLFYGLRDGGIDTEKSFAEHLPFPEDPTRDVVVDNYLKEASTGIIGKPIEKLCVAKEGWEKEIGEKGFTKDSFDSNGSHEVGGYHQDYKGDKERIKSGFTHLFTRGAHKFFLPFTDIFGMENTYNISNTCNDTNWTMRLPENWEEKYHKRLQEGFGFNAPEIFSRVMRKKGQGKDETAQVLRVFGKILREEDQEILTQVKADEKLGTDYVDSRLLKDNWELSDEEKLELIEKSMTFKIADPVLKKTRPDWWKDGKTVEIEGKPVLKTQVLLDSIKSDNWMQGDQVTNGLIDFYKQEYANLQEELGP